MTAAGAGTSGATEASALVAGLVREPWGQVSPSVYETGRLVALAPGLTGHDRRIGYLLRAQRPDGGWGSPEPGYALVPTLSATDALLSTRRAEPPRGADAAAAVGLRTLFRWLRGPGALTAADLPDLPAIELIVPSLVRSINARLDALPPPAAGWWPGGERLRLPAGMHDATLDLIRERLAAGHGVPTKLLHALEVAGDAARDHPLIRPEDTGTVGASPAATVAWLGDPAAGEEGSPAWSYLERAARRHGGPVPCGLPITVFERAWVLGWLVRAGVPIRPPAELVTTLASAIGPSGTAAAAGLPRDADTTAGALYALALCGAPQPPDPLWAFESPSSPGHFRTWPGEEGVSVSTNAHVLEAFGQYERTAGPEPAREPEAGAGAAGRSRRETIAAVAAWLRGRQRADGGWEDRWHASPYYATSCAALALDAFGGRESRPAVDRAVRWILATQRPDGGWGRWESTAEETAYAVQLLLLAGRSPGAGPAADTGPADAAPHAPAQRREAVSALAACRVAGAEEPAEEIRLAGERGCAFLLRWPPGADGPALWHDKDLYQPTAIVRAAVLAALHLGGRYGLLPDRQGTRESDISA